MYIIFYSGSTLTGYLETQAIPYPTILHRKCALLLSSDQPNRCQQCTLYRKTLHVFSRRHSQVQSQNSSATSSHTNYRYLPTPQMLDRLRLLHSDNRCLQKQLGRCRDHITSLIAKEGVTLDAGMSQDMSTIMEEENARIVSKYEEHSFQRIFWEQQKAAVSGNSRGMCWHPAMIRWCLFLRHQSSKAYEALRSSRCIKLPS